VTERENTLGAFRAAVELGVDGVELDVRQCADGALVVHHDAIVEGRAIALSRSSELADHVASFHASMEAMAGVRVNVEMKNGRDVQESTYDESGEFARRVVSYLRDAGWRDSVIVSCFDLATCDAVRRFDPDIDVGWLLDWDLDVAQAIATAREHALSAVHPYFEFVDAARLREARDAGLAVNVWTVNAPSDIAAMLALGVDGVITDDPVTALSLARP
jgi:glycerophosphoryl diester phosphodiesterase